VCGTDLGRKIAVWLTPSTPASLPDPRQFGSVSLPLIVGFGPVVARG
jgi:hypothetical protein